MGWPWRLAKGKALGAMISGCNSWFCFIHTREMGACMVARP